MTKFKATNNNSYASTSFYYRVLYAQDAFKGINDGPEVRNLTFAENTLYGRVDPRLNTIYPKENKLIALSQNENTEDVFRLLDFAADAFTAVSDAMKNAQQIGTIPNDDPIFSRFAPKKAYISPFVLYNNYIDLLMEDYINNFLYSNNIKQKVFTYKQFVENLLLFLKSKPDHTPLTFTSWQRSKTSNIFTTGIAVDIGGLNIGNDPITEERVLKSPCFEYYLNVCRQNGFIVSELTPTIMVADIMSPGLLPYAKNRNIYSTNALFIFSYEYAFTVDIELLMQKFMSHYNNFASTYPFERIVQSACRKNTSIKFVDRKTMTAQQIEDDFHMKERFALYTHIRNFEENNVLSGNEIKKILKTIKMTKNIDNRKTMRYINEQFRVKYKSKYGGTNYFIKRQNERNKDTAPSISSTVENQATNTTEIETGVSGVSETTPAIGGGSSGGY